MKGINLVENKGYVLGVDLDDLKKLIAIIDTRLKSFFLHNKFVFYQVS